MKRRWTILVALAIAAPLLAIVLRPSDTQIHHSPAQPDGFVSHKGTQLYRHGVPFRFIGVNCYRLAEFAPEAGAIFHHLSQHGIRAVRFWAFQTHCGPTGRDFTKFDQLVAAAIQHDILLLPVLENHWSQCTHSEGYKWKPPEWYAAGWQSVPFAGSPLSYRDYIRALTSHYRDQPQILAWQLMNEPEIYPDTSANHQTLRRFARQAAREVKSAAPHHLVSLGLLGLGQPSTTGARYRALHDFPEMDIVSAHDHGYMKEPMPGKQAPLRRNHFYADLLDARALKKPFLATESGIAVEWTGGNLDQRAAYFRAKIRAFFEAGGVGYLLWNYEPKPDTNYGFGPDDPVLAIIAEAARDL
jgi:endo-1,4-beta-mannosidase